ncbi:MAG: hypothetical protein N2C14_15390, partial [Planctomycetales bacterium]
GRIYCVRFNRDGSRFAAASSFQGKGFTAVHETETGKRISFATEQQGGVFAVAFSPRGDRIAVGGFDGLIRLRDAATGRLIREFSPVPPSVTAAGNNVGPGSSRVEGKP